MGGILTLSRGRILYHHLVTYDLAPGFKGLDSIVNLASMITLGETRASWNQGKENKASLYIVLGLILRTSLNPEFAAPPQRT